MSDYLSEIKKMQAKFEPKFEALQKKFNAELRALSLKAKKIATKQDSNELWDKKYASKHAKLMAESQKEAIKLWEKYH